MIQPSDAAIPIGILIRLDRRRRRRKLSYAAYIRLRKITLAEFTSK